VATGIGTGHLRDTNTGEKRYRLAQYVQGCIHPGGQVAVPTSFWSVAPNICGSSVWKMLRVNISGAYKFEAAPRFVANLCTSPHARTHTHTHIYSGCKPVVVQMKYLKYYSTLHSAKGRVT
jgi:hypothetical protein